MQPSPPGHATHQAGWLEAVAQTVPQPAGESGDRTDAPAPDPRGDGVAGQLSADRHETLLHGDRGRLEEGPPRTSRRPPGWGRKARCEFRRTPRRNCGAKPGAATARHPSQRFARLACKPFAGRHFRDARRRFAKPCKRSKRRARDSNPQPLSGHLISSQTASRSLTLHPRVYPMEPAAARMAVISR